MPSLFTLLAGIQEVIASSMATLAARRRKEAVKVSRPLAVLSWAVTVLLFVEVFALAANLFVGDVLGSLVTAAVAVAVVSGAAVATLKGGAVPVSPAKKELLFSVALIGAATLTGLAFLAWIAHGFLFGGPLSDAQAAFRADLLRFAWNGFLLAIGLLGGRVSK